MDDEDESLWCDRERDELDDCDDDDFEAWFADSD